MRKVHFNDGEEAVETDYNDVQAVTEQAIQDALYDLYGQAASGFVGGGFRVTADSGMDVSMATGRGYLYDGTEVDADKAKFKPMANGSARSITVPTADPSNPRIDLVCIAPARSLGSAISRLYMDAASLAITTESLNKRDTESYAYQYVQGTPAGSPAEPAVPSGYVAVAAIDVAAAVSSISSGNITDKRNVLPYVQTPTAPSAGSVPVSSLSDGAENAPHSGLNYVYKAQTLNRFDASVVTVAAGTIALTDNATNNVEVSPAGTVSKRTDGLWTSGYLPMAEVVTSGGAITTVTDKRAWRHIMPQQLAGDTLPKTYVLIGSLTNTTTYTVPAGKRLVILAMTRGGSAGGIRIGSAAGTLVIPDAQGTGGFTITSRCRRTYDGTRIIQVTGADNTALHQQANVDAYAVINAPFLGTVEAGQVIYGTNTTSTYLLGYLVDAPQYAVTPSLAEDLTKARTMAYAAVTNASTYTVPTGYRFVLLGAYFAGSVSLMAGSAIILTSTTGSVSITAKCGYYYTTTAIIGTVLGVLNNGTTNSLTTSTTTINRTDDDFLATFEAGAVLSASVATSVYILGYLIPTP